MRNRIQNALLFSAFCCGLTAQTAPQSNTDGAISPAIEGGNPASSYALSGLDHVNPYNGNLNVTIPLLRIGGRGTAGYTMVLPINRRWGVRSYGGSPAAFDWQGSPDGNPPAYSPGMLTERDDSGQPGACWDSTTGNWYDLGPYVSRIIWTAPDGSETTLVDAAYGGQPLLPPAGNGSDCPTFLNAALTNRGRVFRSLDGSGLTFVSNADISDSNMAGANYVASGVLYFRDGTKYIIGSWGEVDTIEDRNGNLVQLTYGYDSSWNEILTVVDALNRTIHVVEGSTQDTITYPGASGSHTITISHNSLQNTLGSGYSPETYQCLFPELSGSSQTTYNPPWFAQTILLPDGSYYQFQYNSYGELTRLQLPTGGVYQYSYPMAQSCQSNTGSGVIPVGAYSGYSIYRRVAERDEYADGVNLSAKQIFPTPVYGNADPNHSGRVTTAAEVDYEDAGGNLLRKETHFFYGNPSAPDSIPALPTDSPKWTDGMEFRTEIGDAGVTLQTIQQVYGQRPCGALDPNCWFDPQADAAPPHDPQVCQSNTTLDNGAVATVTFAYDQYNNPTDKWEYD